MVSANTIDTINLVTDINIEYNIKLFLMIAMWLYFAFVFWLSFKFDGDRLFIKIWRLFSRVIPVPYLVFAPMFIFFLLRTVEFEILYVLMMAFYSIFLVIWFVLFLIAMWEYALHILGFRITPKKMVQLAGAKDPFKDPFLKK